MCPCLIWAGSLCAQQGKRPCASQCWGHGDKRLTSELRGGPAQPLITWHPLLPLPFSMSISLLSDTGQETRCLENWPRCLLHLSLCLFPLHPNTCCFPGHEFPESREGLCFLLHTHPSVCDITWGQDVFVNCEVREGKW